MKIKFKEISIPKNGNCLFSSLSIPLEISQEDLRKLIPIYISQNKYSKFNDITLNNWIKLESNVIGKNIVKK